MGRRSSRSFRVAAALALVVVFLSGSPMPGAETGPVCPQCGAPLEPGAAFCGKCGRKVEGAAAPAVAEGPSLRTAVVQVVTAHDEELTSTLGSLAYESNFRIDSILGSAFAIAPGEFVTDSGLLVGAKEVQLRTSSGRTVKAQVIGGDSMIGVALLKADLPEVTVLTLREGEPLRAGESLKATGFPSAIASGGEPTVSSGIVSGLHRGAVGIHPIEDYLQTDASMPRGLAGGPMLDARGQVVGMSTGLVLGSRVLLGPQSGIGYAVPGEWVRRAVAWIRGGAPPRGWIGAYAVAADPESRAKFGLPPQARLVVDQIFPGSPAAAAGLKRGDGLMKVEGEDVSSLSGLQARFLAAKPGDSMTLRIARGGESLDRPLTLVPRPDKPRLQAVDALRFFGGLELLAEGGDRLVVGTVAPGSEPALFKVGKGDILLSVLSKKDWTHGAKDNSRWRSVHTAADLEERIQTAYSDLDFCLGLRFRSKDGTKREVFLWEILTPTAAL
ncbi:MAG TPA: trypsin-like peptidase domain-containing protein [Candidatus Binatia bacterium]|nr:trypsin-like peptidase domain-containing protein [Candidatus Binatia bacterium]